MNNTGNLLYVEMDRQVGLAFYSSLSYFILIALNLL